MCGITGILAPGIDGDLLDTSIRSMTQALRHRGPDDHGVWTDRKAGIALGHRRLAILDLSPRGHQPMEAASGQYAIVYNGEIYNHLALRKNLQLKGHSFRGSSDTETLLAAISEWGLEATVNRLVGMFAFALWDKKNQTLSLVRDRLGIKPLYYGFCNNSHTFLFASELKSIRAHQGFKAALDDTAVALYFQHGWIPAPHSIYMGIHKLEPGSIATLCQDSPPAVTRYWSPEASIARGIATPFLGTPAEAVDKLDEILRESVALRMLSDVPLGAMLSGGIDSSLISALMQSQSTKQVKTFSIGFAESGYNEARHAKKVAQHLGTDHKELYVEPDDLINLFPSLPDHYDEPFADSSQIPTLKLCELVRKDVTVCLSGDGGDEFFLGYRRYSWADRWQHVRRVPLPIRKLMQGAADLIPSEWVKRCGPMASKIHWRRPLLSARTFTDFYQGIMAHHWPDGVLKTPRHKIFTPPARWDQESHRLKTASWFDAQYYLPDDILTKVDRASMACSLEARIPLLDHRVVEFAYSLPSQFNQTDANGKNILRQLLYRYIPPKIVDRKKTGFAVPLEEWLGGQLRDWCESLLDSNALNHQGYIDPKGIRETWQAYLAGQKHYCSILWDAFSFLAWLDKWKI